MKSGRLDAETIKAAANGGLLASAASITSGVALTASPVKLLGLITLGTATTVSWPVVAGAGVAGATAAYMLEKKRQRDVEEDFESLLGQG